MSSNDNPFTIGEDDPRTGFEATQRRERLQRARKRQREERLQELRAESRRDAVREFDEQIGTREITESDIIRDDDVFRLRDDVARSVAAADFDAEFSEFDIDSGDVIAAEDGEGFKLGTSTTKAIAARDFDDQFAVNIKAEDIRKTDDGNFVLDESARKRVDVKGEKFREINRKFKQVQAAEGIAEDLSEEFGVDLSLDDVNIAGDSISLTSDARKEIVAEQIDDQTEVDVGPGDLVETGDGFALDSDSKARKIKEGGRRGNDGDGDPRDGLGGDLGGDFEDIIGRRRGDLPVAGEGDGEGDGDGNGDGSGENPFSDVDGISIGDIRAAESLLDDFDKRVEAAEPKKKVAETDPEDAETSFELTDEVQQEIAAERLDEKVEQQDITADDVQQTESGGFELSEQATRSVAATQLSQELGADTRVTESDIVLSDGQTQLTEDARRRIRAGQLGVASEDLEAGLAAQTFDREFSGPLELSAKGTSLAVASTKPFSTGAGLAKPLQESTPFVPDVDVGVEDVRQTDDGFQLRQGLREEIEARNLDAQFPGINISSENISIDNGAVAIQGQPRRELQAREFARRADATVENVEIDQSDVLVQDGTPQLTAGAKEAITEQRLQNTADTIANQAGVNPTTADLAVDDGQISFTDDFRADIIADRFQEQTLADLDRGDDFNVEFAETRSGIQSVPFQSNQGTITPPEDIASATLTATGRRKETLAKAEQEGELGGVDITNPASQIEFDDEGNVVGIEPSTPVSDTILDTATDIASNIGDRAAPVADPAIESLEGIENAADSSALGEFGDTVFAATAGPMLSNIASAAAFGSAIRQRSALLREATETQLVEPAAAAAGGTVEFTAANNPFSRVFGTGLQQDGDPTTPTSDIGKTIETGVATAGKTITTATVGAADLPTVKQRSDDAVQAVQRNISDPLGAGAGRALELAAMNDPRFAATPIAFTPVQREGQADIQGFDNVTEPETNVGEGVGNFVGGNITGVAGLTVGLPGDIIRLGETATGAATFTAEQVSEEGIIAGGTTALAAGGTVAASRGANVLETAESRPGTTAGTLVGGSIASAAVSPIRAAKFSVPVKSGGDVTLRGIRVAEPRILRGRVDLPGKTIAGAKGIRPTAGTPSVDPDKIDFNELEGRGATTEPGGRFETAVLRAVATRAGPSAAARFRAAEALVAQGVRADSELELTSTEDIVRQAEEVPDDAAPAIADALKDLDATIFGSAATRAQVPSARTPRDLDIAVDDKVEAVERLSDAIEEFDADVDIFDIKSRDEKAVPGEIVKFGRIAQQRLETDEGVRVTPVGEELIKKAGASAFLRGRGSPAPEFPGDADQFDVGPEPVSEGAFIRAKDAGDASLIATELLGSSGRISAVNRIRARRNVKDVIDFRDEFAEEIERATAKQPPLSKPRSAREIFALDEFVESERAQFGGGRRNTDSELDANNTESAEALEDGSDTGSRDSIAERAGRARAELDMGSKEIQSSPVEFRQFLKQELERGNFDEVVLRQAAQMGQMDSDIIDQAVRDFRADADGKTEFGDGRLQPNLFKQAGRVRAELDMGSVESQSSPAEFRQFLEEEVERGRFDRDVLREAAGLGPMDSDLIMDALRRQDDEDLSDQKTPKTSGEGDISSEDDSGLDNESNRRTSTSQFSKSDFDSSVGLAGFDRVRTSSTSQRQQGGQSLPVFNMPSPSTIKSGRVDATQSFSSQANRSEKTVSSDAEISSRSPIASVDSKISSVGTAKGFSSRSVSSPPRSEITPISPTSPVSKAESGGGEQTTSIPITTNRGDDDRRRQDDPDKDESEFDLAFRSSFAKRFGGGVATPDSVLEAEGPTDVGFFEGFEQSVEPATGIEVVSVEGDLPSDTKEDFGP